jgi:hypothetical protein
MVAVIVPIVLHSTVIVAVIREREESIVPMMVTTVRVVTIIVRAVIRGRIETVVPAAGIAVVATSSVKAAIRVVLTIVRVAISSAHITARKVISSVRAAIRIVPTIAKVAISSARVVIRTVPEVTIKNVLQAIILMPSTA